MESESKVVSGNKSSNGASDLIKVFVDPSMTTEDLNEYMVEAGYDVITTMTSLPLHILDDDATISRLRQSSNVVRGILSNPQVGASIIAGRLGPALLEFEGNYELFFESPTFIGVDLTRCLDRFLPSVIAIRAIAQNIAMLAMTFSNIGFRKIIFDSGKLHADILMREYPECRQWLMDNVAISTKVIDKGYHATGCDGYVLELYMDHCSAYSDSGTYLGDYNTGTYRNRTLNGTRVMNERASSINLKMNEITGYNRYGTITYIRMT